MTDWKHMIKTEIVREMLLSLPHAEECMPFGEDALVYKVGGRMFALLSLGLRRSDMDKGGYMMVKCDPEEAERLRAHYAAVEPAYHMNKRHWNGIWLDADMPMEQIIEQARASYRLVYDKLPRKTRAELETLPRASEKTQD